MQAVYAPNTLAQPFWPVKSLNSQFPLSFPNSMIHHKLSLLPSKIIVSSNNIGINKAYGVSRTYRVLSPGLLVKKFDLVRDFLQYTLGLTLAQREVTLRLLTYWAYYAQVYVKEAQVTSEPGCSKATYWRTIRLLRSRGLIRTIPRFIIRPHAQISNLYRFDKLVLLIARYLAEHGVAFWEKWLKPALAMPGRQFWSQVWETPGVSAAPGALAYSGP